MQNGSIEVSGAPRNAIPDIVARLVQAGLCIYAVTPQEPSLTDVYFALQEREEAR